MKKLILLCLALFSVQAFAAGGSSVPLKQANNRLNDVDSLRRGAKLFAQQCSSCHTAKYVRYSDIANQLQWSEKEMDEQLIQGRSKIHDTLVGGMDETIAKQLYGKAIPDLSLIEKVHGVDWLFTYLQAYYTDENGAVNNYVFPNVAMPNVLGGFQGPRIGVYAEVDGHRRVIGSAPANKDASQADKRKREAKEYRFQRSVRDLVNFMELMSEPNKLERHSLGIKVILFLLVLLLIFILLKKEYWRDVK